MDPATYNEDAYRSELLQKMRMSETIVYQAIFTPENISGEETVLVAATSSGLIHVYRLSKVMTAEYWDQVKRGEYARHDKI
uniref:Uncharacterized protein n=1 Tax=Hyaloperonospora arabidopsidis (strain Emoy2) TaxID=559515 RepID=M4C6R8_HYAAE